MPNPSLGLAEKLPVYRYTIGPIPYSHQPCTGTRPAEGYPRADQKFNFSDFSAKLQTSILGIRIIGRDTIYDPPQSVEKLGTPIKHSNLAICKGPGELLAGDLVTGELLTGELLIGDIGDKLLADNQRPTSRSSLFPEASLWSMDCILKKRYYTSQQLTDKSDVYSFGVVLLELISGRKHISVEGYGAKWNIVHWARSLICKGDIASVIDPSLNGAFKIESVWRVAECAVLSVELRGALRPSMQEVEVAIQDAIQIEKGSRNLRDSCSTSSTFRPSLDQFSSDALELCLQGELFGEAHAQKLLHRHCSASSSAAVVGLPIIQEAEIIGNSCGYMNIEDEDDGFELIRNDTEGITIDADELNIDLLNINDSSDE
uniref:non-specific serine/threonine protein kinase n=1 Tax=Ananas comosus var. bracteatus TaxID=296719 RepID=A0A6V7NYB2_ANACO|nr:unnamed protein product [Ananas comosus var. bracteatus]